MAAGLRVARCCGSGRRPTIPALAIREHNGETRRLRSNAPRSPVRPSRFRAWVRKLLLSNWFEIFVGLQAKL